MPEFGTPRTQPEGESSEEEEPFNKVEMKEEEIKWTKKKLEWSEKFLKNCEIIGGSPIDEDLKDVVSRGVIESKEKLVKLTGNEYGLDWREIAENYEKQSLDLEDSLANDNWNTEDAGILRKFLEEMKLDIAKQSSKEK